MPTSALAHLEGISFSSFFSKTEEIMKPLNSTSITKSGQMYASVKDGSGPWYHEDMMVEFGKDRELGGRQAV